jgi:cadmium resistance protein CadD (predicted permease)
VIIETAAATAVACATTNVDDVAFLGVFFARRSERFRARQILLGQCLGTGVVLGLSFGAGIGLLALPDPAVGALGVIPLSMGLRGLREARGPYPEADAMSPLSALGVASVTIANGGDTIAVYAPFFARVGAESLSAMLVVFAMLTSLSSALALLISHSVFVRRTVRQAGPYAVPAVLIGVGVYVIADSGILTWLLSRG